MSYEEVIAILGENGQSVGAKAILYAYNTVESEKVILNYCHNAEGTLVLINILYR